MAVILSQTSRKATAVLRYVLNDKPDPGAGSRFVAVSGIGVWPSVAEAEFARVRKTFGKEKGYIQAYSLVQSFNRDEFDPDDPSCWDRVNDLGRAVALDRFPGHQVVVVTQCDGEGGYLHNHIIVNAVNTQTGRSIRGSAVTHRELAMEHDRILAENGFTNTVKRKDHQAERVTKAERYYPAKLEAWRREEEAVKESEAAGDLEASRSSLNSSGSSKFKSKPRKPAETTLKERIREAMNSREITSFARFQQVCQGLGVDVQQRGGKGRGITYALLDDQGVPMKSSRRRSTSLGTDFNMDAVEAAIGQQMIRNKLAVIMADALFTSLQSFALQCEGAGLTIAEREPGADKESEFVFGLTEEGSEAQLTSTQLGADFFPSAITEIAEEIREIRQDAPQMGDVPIEQVLEALGEEEYSLPLPPRSSRGRESKKLPPARERFLELQRSRAADFTL